jgi:hypothetical protein
MNFRLVRHMTSNPAAAVLSLRRFAEAELGIGLTISDLPLADTKVSANTIV